MEAKVVKQKVKQLHKQKTLEEQNPHNLASKAGVPGATRTRDPLLRSELAFSGLSGPYFVAVLDPIPAEI